MPKPALVYSSAYSCDIGPHVFPVEKYALVREALRASGADAHADTLEPPPAGRPLLALAHDDEYLDDLEALRWTPRTMYSELPLDADVLRAFALAAAGTTLAAREALARGASAHVGGGFHHAFSGHAEGFCYYNDLAIAVRALQREGRVRRAAIVDLDVHQGNGTAGIFADDPGVFTLSMHQERNYPVPKEHSDLDVGLEDGAADERYLELLAPALERVWAFAPEIVLYQAGADPYRHDQLGGLALSLDGLAARDRHVIEGCARRGIAIATTLGGGYARRLEDTVAIHAETCRIALEVGAQAGARR